jgi:hypothetical protein
MDQLAQSQVQVVARLDRLDARVERLDSHVGTLRGQSLEGTFRDRAPSYFARLFRRIHVLTREELGRLLEDAEDRGALTPADHEEVLRSDAVVRGRDRVTGENAYLVGEISAVVDEHDVSRALRRAEILRRVAGAAATPVVAGEEITGTAAQLCQERGVWQVLDGGIVTPPS